MKHTGFAALALLAGAAPASAPLAPPVPAMAQPETTAPDLSAIPIALLYDAGSGRQLYGKQENLRFLPASVTKVMTVYVAFELMAKGKLRPDRRFTVSHEAYQEWHGKGTSMNLADGESVTVDALLRGLTTVSANDAAIILAEGYAGDVETWCKLMNAEASRLGMLDSHFNTPNGWSDNRQTYVSARDLVKLGQALVNRHPVLYRRYFGKKQMTWNDFTANNHDPNIGVVEGADGIKTGHTNEAGYNYLGSAERNGRRLFMVVAAAPTGPDRKAASRALMNWGFAAWQETPLFKAGSRVGTARVQGGDARQVGLTAPFTIHTLSQAGGAKPRSLRIVYNGPLIAPLTKGDQVAELEITAADNTTSTVPLFAAESVQKAGILDRLINGLAGLIE